MDNIKEDRKIKYFKAAAFLFFAVILVVLSFSAGAYLTKKSELVDRAMSGEAEYLGRIVGKYGFGGSGRLSSDLDFGLFWEVWDIIREQYVDEKKLDEKTMFYGALRGLVDSTGDPYTVFLDPEEAREFADDLAGSFEGIGAEIGIRDEILTVIAPLPGTPAEKAGLMPGDKILTIDSEPTTDLSVEQAVKKIRGPKGTEVVLMISRDGLKDMKEVKIIREAIVIKSVRTELRKDGIFVITITNFNEDTSELFSAAVEEVLEKNPRALVLDLRNNPGGFLETAVEVASEWIEEGTIVSEQFGNGERNDFPARGRARLAEFKTAVIVNEGSASASEIVAGALKDYGRAVIIGQETFGKGSVQSLQDLRDGSSVKITVAKWLTPQGNDINEQGIMPDEKVEMTFEDYEAGRDPQMDKAVERAKSL